MSIKVTVGKSFRIPLESNLGSTPLGWCLKKMPEGVMFHYQENIAIGAMSNIQMFHFITTAQIPSDNACLEFALIDFTTLEEKNTFNLSVVAVEQTTNEAGKDNFIEFAGNTPANRTNQAYNPAIDYRVLQNNRFNGVCMNREYDVMPRSAFQGNPDCVPAVPYGVLPNNQFDGACIDMMYHMQPRSAFQGNPACVPAVPYGVLPNNQFDGTCMNRAYDMQPRSAFQGNPACAPAVPYGVLPNNRFDGACIDMMYHMQPRSAFQGNSACAPAVPYGVLPNNRFDGVCMNRFYDIMPRSAF